MRLLSTIAAVLYLSSVCFTQVHLDALDKAGQIKLLHADRESVRSVLNQFVLEAGDDSDDYFESAEAKIEISYSTGTCDEDESEVWKVAKGKAVLIEIEPKSEFQLADFGFSLSDFTKEQRLVDIEDDFVYHSKARGIAIYVDSHVVERILLFPPITSKAKVCKYKEAREFISHKSWFGSLELKDRQIISCGHPNVTDLRLSTTDLGGTSSRRVDVVTTSTDPENDILIFNYTVTAGRIIGNGSKVVWDLAGVHPGSYSITAGIDDGCGLCGSTRTETVVVR